MLQSAIARTGYRYSNRRNVCARTCSGNSVPSFFLVHGYVWLVVTIDFAREHSSRKSPWENAKSVNAIRIK